MTHQSTSPETTEPTEQKPWAFIAHKGEKWGGVCSPEANKKTISEFMISMVSSGYSIKTVFSREEYDAELARLK